jgi:hypothetical protein
MDAVTFVCRGQLRHQECCHVPDFKGNFPLVGAAAGW